jgi:hypothetical protein
LFTGTQQKLKNTRIAKDNLRCNIHIIGKASMMSKYNPLDIKLDITTEEAEE